MLKRAKKPSICLMAKYSGKYWTTELIENEDERGPFLITKLKRSWLKVAFKNLCFFPISFIHQIHLSGKFLIYEKSMKKTQQRTKNSKG